MNQTLTIELDCPEEHRLVVIKKDEWIEVGDRLFVNQRFSDPERQRWLCRDVYCIVARPTPKPIRGKDWILPGYENVQYANRHNKIDDDLCIHIGTPLRWGDLTEREQLIYRVAQGPLYRKMEDAIKTGVS